MRRLTLDDAELMLAVWNDPDIGYAILPGYRGEGVEFERMHRMTDDDREICVCGMQFIG